MENINDYYKHFLQVYILVNKPETKTFCGYYWSGKILTGKKI